MDPRSGTVLVWGAVHAGEASNAIPQHGVLRGTLRTADHATWGGLEEKVRALVAAILAPLGVGYTLDHVRGVPPVVNEAVSSEMLADAAFAIGRAGGVDEHRAVQRRRGLRLVPGARARRHGAAGRVAGHGPMRDIHAPTFDLDERALPFGVRVLTRAALAGPDRPPPDGPGRRVSRSVTASLRFDDGESRFPERRRGVAVSTCRRAVHR